MRIRLALLTLVFSFSGCSKKEPVSAINPEQEFQKMISGSTLVGHSTMDGKSGLSDEERYVIQKVFKLTGDTWMFESRMKAEGLDIPLPIPVQIKWAGDTPVITVTDFSIPKMGTYTARVVLYRGQYAGTWSGIHAGGKVFGGQLFGKIVPNESK
jgi:hypothetical protein